MADSAELTRRAILDAFREAPIDSLSDGSLQQYVTERVHPVSKLDVQQAAAELMDQGRLEVVSRKGSDRRYRVPSRRRA